MVEIILYSTGVVWVYMAAWYVFALYAGRNDVADVAWGLGFATVAAALFLRADTPDIAKSYIALAMVALWGYRLAVHIGARALGKSEDGRYVDMKKGWKYKKLQAYTNVFLSQGFLMLLVSTPIILYFADGSPQLQWFNVIGLGVWAFGLFFEAVGDYQLKQFIKTKKDGEIMTSGLWKYTRHPNYFGEITTWWGFFIFTLFIPYWYIGVVGPITITYLILGVSGIPMLEKRYEGNKKYEKYQKTTNAFFPGPKKD